MSWQQPAGANLVLLLTCPDPAAAPMRPCSWALKHVVWLPQRPGQRESPHHCPTHTRIVHTPSNARAAARCAGSCSPVEVVLAWGQCNKVTVSLFLSSASGPHATCHQSLPFLGKRLPLLVRDSSYSLLGPFLLPPAHSPVSHSPIPVLSHP